MLWSSVAVAIYGFATYVAALDPIEAVGNKFFNKDGSQFFIKGVAYQLRPHDPLIDTDQCKRDASLMKELGTNTIRVYHVDASADHDGCMTAFNDAGIYVLADLDTFDTYILPENLYWNRSQYDRYTEVMDAFQQYDNILGFFIGNENIAKEQDSKAAPFLKAAARDMKAYRDHKGYRKIPVGYSAADIQQLRPMLQDYLTCGGNSSEIIDFFSLNSYSWCDPSTYQQSTYDQLELYAKNFPVPMFLSETGCNVPGPRKWDDQDAIFGKDMVNDWSGAIIYEWIQEENNYGIITYGPYLGDGTSSDPSVEGGFTRKGTPTPRNPDFDTLKTKWAGLHPTGVKKADYNPSSVSTRSCPTATLSGWWEVDGNVKLPTLGDALFATITPSPKKTTIAVTTATSSTVQTTTTSKPSEPTTTGSSGDKGSDANKDNKGNSAPGNSRITIVGVSLISVVVTFALLL
ncbi:Protein EPD1 [Cladobotryum mycophilum]|uniref:1,3-beta-glucanosyltransferase n=1 Tax=Cladobotryum mycophilum TaxID=491253 RepID=A0ABR0T0D5_9HYPO